MARKPSRCSTCTASAADLQAALRAPIYEDKVVDLIFGKAKIDEKEVSKDELLEEDDLPEGYGG
jgi:trigger factor